MVEDDESFLRFINADVAQLSGFLLCQGLAEKNLLSDWVSEAFDHQGDCNQKRERSKNNEAPDG
jgi:hypothetical protein